MQDPLMTPPPSTAWPTCLGPSRRGASSRRPLAPRIAAAVLAWGVMALAADSSFASSHREAPFVTKNSKIDGTDLYAFESYETGRTGMVTVIANYQPFQDGFGGPNYFPLDEDALYEIMIDNNGDGVEDFTFQFRFQQALGGSGAAGLALNIGPDGGMAIAVPFYNVGRIPNPGNTANSNALNFIETYTLTQVAGPRRTGTASTVSSGGNSIFGVPADNVGASSFPSSDYDAYARNFVYDIALPNCSEPDSSSGKVFVGQRAESFAANLGPIFDLIDIPASVVTGGTSSSQYAAISNPLAKKNVTSLALELPRDCIWQNAQQTVIGVWTTASVRQVRIVNPVATYVQPSREGGAWTQVSRLGNPLVNEVVVGLPDKDLFNSSAPVNDVTNFAKYVEYPTFPAIFDAIFGTDFQPTVFPRTDLVSTFLLGQASLNAFPVPDASGTPAIGEYIHLNTNTEALVGGTNPTPAGQQDRLGFLHCFVNGSPTPTASGCDPFGFPNGRRPGDDVVDISLDVLEGYLLPSGNPAAGTFFADGVDQAATTFNASFPYLTTPTQGANGDGT